MFQRCIVLWRIQLMRAIHYTVCKEVFFGSTKWKYIQGVLCEDIKNHLFWARSIEWFRNYVKIMIYYTLIFKLISSHFMFSLRNQSKWNRKAHDFRITSHLRPPICTQKHSTKIQWNFFPSRTNFSLKIIEKKAPNYSEFRRFGNKVHKLAELRAIIMQSFVRFSWNRQKNLRPPPLSFPMINRWGGFKPPPPDQPFSHPLRSENNEWLIV